VLHHVARPCPAPVLSRSHLVNPIQFEERLAYNLDKLLILVLFQAGEKDVSSFCDSRSALGTTQVPIQSVTVSFPWSKEARS
jgi:hypothetical protein